MMRKSDNLNIDTHASGGNQSIPFIWLVMGVFCLSLLLIPNDVKAQNLSQFSRSYVTPFPEDDRHRLYVFGDSLAEGVWTGMDAAFANDSRVEVFRKVRYSEGFIRNRNNWSGFVKDILKHEKVHIAVLMIGANDNNSFWVKNGKLNFGSKEWREKYVSRVDELIKTLKKSKAAIYWVGIPIVRSPKVNKDMQLLNEIYRERSFLNGIKFIDTWNGFADQFGRFSAYGPDLTGKVKKLRANDGIHFTFRGNRKLAHFVEREIRRDLALARSERNIPLAGNEEEQMRAIRRMTLKKVSKIKKDNSQETGDGQASGKNSNDTNKKASAWAGKIQTKAGDKQVVTIGDVKIIRPALPDAALRSILGSSRSRAGSNLASEVVASDLSGDLTALGSISSANALSLELGKSSIPLTQMPSYKVLIRGETLEPKSGRADDFSWPKESS